MKKNCSMHTILLLSAMFLVPIMARQLHFVKNTTDEILVESKGKDDTIGFGFDLFHNVLTVKINATATNMTDSGSGNYVPISMRLTPLRILQLANLTSVNDTSITSYPFYTSNNGTSDWPGGFGTTKYQEDVLNGTGKADIWAISAKYASPTSGGPNFTALLLITNEKTTFQGMKLSPEAITMLFSILLPSDSSSTGTLALDQLFLSRRAFVRPLFEARNSSSNSTWVRKGFGLLAINRTALVDDKEEPIVLLPISSAYDDNLVRNVSDYATIERNAERFALAFLNSKKAQNVTFEERLIVNLTQVHCNHCGSSSNNNGDNPTVPMAESASSRTAPAFWSLLLSFLLSSLTILAMASF